MITKFTLTKSNSFTSDVPMPPPQYTNTSPAKTRTNISPSPTLQPNPPPVVQRSNSPSPQRTVSPSLMKRNAPQPQTFTVMNTQDELPIQRSPVRELPPPQKVPVPSKPLTQSSNQDSGSLDVVKKKNNLPFCFVLI